MTWELRWRVASVLDMEVESLADRPAVRVDMALTFDEFYRSSREDVARALVLTLGNRDFGIEAADEAMARAFQRWATVRAYDNPAGWAFRVGLNWARSAWRKRGREVSSDLYMPDVVHDDQVDVDLEEALARLDVRFRAVVVLRFYLDWSIEATAAALGVRPGTVKSRLSRALGRLSDDLEDGEE